MVAPIVKSIYRKIVNVELYMFYSVIVIILVLDIVLYFQGINSPWYETIHKPTILPQVINLELWVISYLLSVTGMWLLYHTPSSPDSSSSNSTGNSSFTLPTDRYFASMMVLSVIISFIWLWSFFVLRDICLAVVLQSFNVVYHLWYFYSLWKYNRIAALYQLPLLLFMIYLFVISYMFAWSNPYVDSIL